jgi:glycosyltransferase involved in cell wall biosynthesis
MRIILAHKDIKDPSQGGICTLYKNLAIELSRLGIEVIVITSHKSWKYSGIGRVILKYEGNKIKYAKKVAEVIKKLKPDIAECSNWGYELLFCPNLNGNKTKIVIRSDVTAITYCGDTADLKDGFYEKKLLQEADYRLAVSNFAKKDVESMYGVKIDKVILNGVDLDIFKPLNLTKKNSKIKKIIWIGKPIKTKGIDILQEIIAQAPNNYKFFLVLGSQKFSLPISVSNLSNVTIYKNLHINDLVLLLNKADVLLSTSRVEGFGLVILEAMACGIPVIAPRNLGSVHEFVREGKDGFFYNTPSEIIGFIQKISNRMGLFAREQAENFSWRKNALKTLKVYKEILKCRK